MPDGRKIRIDGRVLGKSDEQWSDSILISVTLVSIILHIVLTY